MSKVLISFLGTGPFNEKTGKREYRTTRYRFSDDKEYTTSFLAAALKDYYSIDRVILVGTVKSMWEEVYRTFAQRGTDEDYFAELGDFCERSNHESPLKLPDIQKLSSAIGNRSEVVLIHYGLTPEEIKKNQEIILSIESLLENGDELYVDITHSFRSLPLFLLNALIYLKTVSGKNVSIKHILYGMFEAIKDLGYAPVIELSSLMDTVDWIVGAYSFKEFGNSYKIAEKLEDKSLSQLLVKFSDMMNLNYLFGIQHETALHGLVNNEYPSRISELTLQPIIKSFCDVFKSKEPAYKVQFNMAVWHKKHHNYSSAFICSQEAMISYICFLNKWNSEDKNRRNQVKDGFFGNYASGFSRQSIHKCNLLSNSFIQINDIRNSLAHSISKEYTVQQMVKILDNSIILMTEVLFQNG